MALTQSSFTNFINTNPDAVIELLDRLKQRKMVKASELLVLLLKYCTLNCEPDWQRQSQQRDKDWICDELSEPVPYPIPIDTDAFWKGYQVMAQNMEFYCINRLIHHLRKLHGPMLFQIDYASRHSSSNLLSLPQQSFKDHFQNVHNSVQNLLKVLIYRVPLLKYNILVESSLFTTSPVQYRVEFVGPKDWATYPYHLRPATASSPSTASSTPLAFCFTSYLKLPPQLTVPPFYFTDRDPGGLVKFIPHDCAQCSMPTMPGLNHTLILSPPSPIF